MTKLQKGGLAVSIISAVLWTIWLFVWWDYSFPPCGWPLWCIDDVDYNLIHYIFIALFAIWIGIVLVDTSRKSLKKSCIVFIISVLLWWFSISFGFRSLYSLCVWDCREVEIPGHISLILWLMFIILWFMSLFFLIKHLTNSKKWSIVVVLIVVSLLGAFFVQSFLIHSEEYISLITWLKSFLNVMFVIFFVISIVFCIVSLIKSHKWAKKSS